MKRITFTFLAVTFCAVTLISCKEHKDETDTMVSGFMTGYTDSEGYITVLSDDFGNQYMVSEKSIRNKPDTLYRLVAVIALDDHNSARILQSIYPISYRAPEETLIPDSLSGNDPIKIESIYIGGGFLNIHVGIMVQKEDTKHSLIYSRLNHSKKLKFTIHHNAYDDKPVYTKYAYLSIPLSEYGLHKNDTVFLSCNGYEEDYNYKLIYK